MAKAQPPKVQPKTPVKPQPKPQVRQKIRIRLKGYDQRVLDRAVADAFFRDNGAAGAQHRDAGLAAAVEFFRTACRRIRCGHAKLRGGGVVDQQEASLFVLHRHAGREQSENIPQNAEIGIRGGFAVLRWGILPVEAGGALHDRRSLAKSLVVLVKWNSKRR